MTVDDQNLQLWDGVFGSFAQARGDDSVFTGDIWMEKLRSRAKTAIAASEGDGAIPPVATSHDYALAYVAALAADVGKPLRILDFGGGMATSYLPLAKMLPASQLLDYLIVENDRICREGRELFARDRRLRFTSALPSPPERFDIVHCGSSLHYVEDWTAVLARLAALAPHYLLLADLPAADNETFVTAQNFHGKRIPVHFWNLGQLIETVGAHGYECILQARYCGSYAGSDRGPPTAHFPPAHRLGYFTQLIFRRRGTD